MGDMADYYYDQGMDELIDGDRDMEPFGSYSRTNRDKHCRYCGKGGFHWELENGAYRLHTAKGQIHTCEEFRARFQTPIDVPPPPQIERTAPRIVRYACRKVK